jgi:hypothetical protein
MIQFNTIIQKFDKKGEKSGWTYIEITAAQAKKLNAASKVSFRVKGKLDNFQFEKLALIPMGEGDFILPLNGRIRKALGKKHGDKLKVVMEIDRRKIPLSSDLLDCLNDDPVAMDFFNSLPGSHQQYFSKWIESAKTAETKTKRIVAAMLAFSKKQGYSEMMRAYRDRNFG